MTRMVHCSKYDKLLPGMDRPPMPGARGKHLYETVSRDAWLAWLKHQTLLINEKHLNLMNPQHRAYLTEQMDRFFANEEVDQAEGFKPEGDGAEPAANRKD